MPYILYEDRAAYIEWLDELIGVFRANGINSENEGDLGGHLNFCISYLLANLFEDRSRYVRINTLLGALEGAKLEFYRFHVAPYEEKKRLANGDV